MGAVGGTSRARRGAGAARAPVAMAAKAGELAIVAEAAARAAEGDKRLGGRGMLVSPGRMTERGNQTLR